jgi:hypothetical protein
VESNHKSSTSTALAIKGTLNKFGFKKECATARTGTVRKKTAGRIPIQLLGCSKIVAEME